MSALATKPRVYGDLDSELPSVAAMAAAEVDDLLRDEDSELKYLKKLSEILSESFQSTNGQSSGAYQLLDPVSTSVITKSFAHSYGACLHTYEELMNASVTLTDEMKIVEQRDNHMKDSSEILLRLKDFCLSLSIYALASKDKIDNFSGSPDYQR